MLIAPVRAGRPHDVGRGQGAAGCPFCPGNEAATPPETLAERPSGGPVDGRGWLVRAIPNKFPALAAHEGVHEVIISSPRHVGSFADLTDDEAGRAVAAWATRLTAVADDPRELWPFLFLNQGAGAGASLHHSHAQLVALPVAPPRLVARDRAFAEASEALLVVDAEDRARRVLDTEAFVVWSPSVPPLSGTVRLAPREPAGSWDEGVDAVELGAVLVRLFAAISSAFGTDDVNLMLYERPPGGTDRYHWHLDVVPRLGTLAGLELGTGVVAANVAPDDAAAALRAVLL